MTVLPPQQLSTLLHRLAVGIAVVGIAALGWVLRIDGTPTSLLIDCILVVLPFGAAIVAVLFVAYRMESKSAASD